MMLLVAGVQAAAAPAYSVVVLPEPVGPVTRMMPCGWCDQALEALQHVAAACPARFQAELALALVQQAQHGALAVRAGQGATRARRRRACRCAGEMRPSCGRRFSAMSSSAMIFRREISAACSARFGLHHLAQRAVDAEAHAGVALVGLDVDVAGAVACGLRQQRVEHADDGRVVRRFQQVFNGWQVLHHARSGPHRSRTSPTTVAALDSPCA